MKYFVISDIHGSASALEMVLEYYRKEQADGLIILGDILYHGPRNPLPIGHNPQAVVNMLNEMSQDIIAVRGNCEAEVDQMVLNFPVMADYNIIPNQKNKWFFTHGHIYNEDKLPPLNKGDIFFYGHTHIACIKETSGIMIINPGSISLPKNNTQASFGVLENNHFRLVSLNYETLEKIDF